MDREQQDGQRERSLWPPTREQVLWTGGTVALLTVAVLIGYRYDITLWDWLKLLVVPVVIAGGGLWFNRQQRERELEIAERRAEDEALQAYLDQMSDMLIPNKDQPSLYKAQPGDSLSSVARARTLTVLPRLDGDRKARVVQFLHESGLIRKNQVVLALSKADLSEANLRNTNLSGADLSGANLSYADLRDADLNYATLRHATLSRADLSRADLTYADLNGAFAFPNEAILSDAFLMNADLSDAFLMNADLSGASLGNADLSGADLSRANLSGADLRGAKNITNEELERKVPFLEGATMPNGQLYEDWRKDKKAKEKDEKNE